MRQKQRKSKESKYDIRVYIKKIQQFENGLGADITAARNIVVHKTWKWTGKRVAKKNEKSVIMVK